MPTDRRVFPLAVDASASLPPTANALAGRQLQLPPPKSPLYSARRHHVAGQGREASGSGEDGALSGFDRMLLLRQMNVTGSGTASASAAPVQSAARPTAVQAPALFADESEVSAAQNLKRRRAAEQQRRQETALMRREDYLDTPEGDARRKRQAERALMLEEELGMRRLLEAEERDRRRLAQVREQQEEARVREQYLAKMRQQREQQEREARDKELARKQALEDKMKALKQAADARAREEAAARQRQMEHDALVDRERRVSAMETALMMVEDALAAAERQQWLAERERQRQIEAEREQWRAFQEQEQAKLREATMQRRAAMAEQNERDKRRKMEIHRLQKQHAAVAAASLHPASPDAIPRPTEEDAASALPPTAVLLPVEADVAAINSSPDSVAASTGKADCAALQIPPGSDDHGNSETSAGLDHVGVERLPAESRETAEVEASCERDDASSSHADPPPTADRPPVTPATWTEASAKASGVHPFAQVQSVADGSPAMEAPLRAGDLILSFGGVVASTPKCLLTVAECVQSHVNQAIALVVLRPAAPEAHGAGHEFQEHSVSLCPRKWKGKGLLGCQLSPFKWPEPDTVERNDAGVEGASDSRADGASNGGAGFVICAVQADSKASSVGLRDGDVLVSCGDLLDVANASVDAISQRVKQAASGLRLEVERWLADEQRYCHLAFELDVGDQACGFSVTTYEQYYYYGFASASTTASSALSACTDCYYSTTPSAVHTAALNGHVECLEALLLLLQAAPTAGSEQAGASVAEYLEWKDDDGRTPLFYACYASQLESARFLVARLGSFDASAGADLYGDTPLHAAVMVGCSPMVRLLLESHYMDANVANSALQTGAHVAPNVGMLRLLEGFDADLLATDREGRMPLAYACLRDDPESVEHLCAAFPDFADYADERGNTPLHLCAWLGLERAARVLVRFLPPIALFLTNLDGCSPVELARANGSQAIAALLEQVMDG